MHPLEESSKCSRFFHWMRNLPPGGIIHPLVASSKCSRLNKTPHPFTNHAVIHPQSGTLQVLLQTPDSASNWMRTYPTLGWTSVWFDKCWEVIGNPMITTHTYRAAHDYKVPKRWRERWWKPPRSTNLAERMAMGTTAKPKFSAPTRMERSRGTSARPKFSEPRRAEIEPNTDKDQVLWTPSVVVVGERGWSSSSLNQTIVGEERGWSPSSLNRKWSAPADSAGFHAILNGRIGPRWTCFLLLTQ